jgi:hypothetical protein
MSWYRRLMTRLWRESTELHEIFQSGLCWSGDHGASRRLTPDPLDALVSISLVCAEVSFELNFAARLLPDCRAVSWR